jgi:hypothetical protein
MVAKPKEMAHVDLRLADSLMSSYAVLHALREFLLS